MVNHKNDSEWQDMMKLEYKKLLISQYKFYKCAQGIKRIYGHNKERIIT